MSLRLAEAGAAAAAQAAATTPGGGGGGGGTPTGRNLPASGPFYDDASVAGPLSIANGYTTLYNDDANFGMEALNNRLVPLNNQQGTRNGTVVRDMGTAQYKIEAVFENDFGGCGMAIGVAAAASYSGGVSATITNPTGGQFIVTVVHQNATRVYDVSAYTSQSAPDRTLAMTMDGNGEADLSNNNGLSLRTFSVVFNGVVLESTHHLFVSEANLTGVHLSVSGSGAKSWRGRNLNEGYTSDSYRQLQWKADFTIPANNNSLPSYLVADKPGVRQTGGKIVGTSTSKQVSHGLTNTLVPTAYVATFQPSATEVQGFGIGSDFVRLPDFFNAYVAARINTDRSVDIITYDSNAKVPASKVLAHVPPLPNAPIQIAFLNDPNYEPIPVDPLYATGMSFVVNGVTAWSGDVFDLDGAGLALPFGTRRNIESHSLTSFIVVASDAGLSDLRYVSQQTDQHYLQAGGYYGADVDRVPVTVTNSTPVFVNGQAFGHTVTDMDFEITYLSDGTKLVHSEQTTDFGNGSSNDAKYSSNGIVGSIYTQSENYYWNPQGVLRDDDPFTLRVRYKFGTQGYGDWEPLPGVFKVKPYIIAAAASGVSVDDFGVVTFNPNYYNPHYFFQGNNPNAVTNGVFHFFVAQLNQAKAVTMDVNATSLQMFTGVLQYGAVNQLQVITYQDWTGFRNSLQGTAYGVLNTSGDPGNPVSVRKHDVAAGDTLTDWYSTVDSGVSIGSYKPLYSPAFYALANFTENEVFVTKDRPFGGANFLVGISAVAHGPESSRVGMMSNDGSVYLYVKRTRTAVELWGNPGTGEVLLGTIAGGQQDGDGTGLYIEKQGQSITVRTFLPYNPLFGVMTSGYDSVTTAFVGIMPGELVTQTVIDRVAAPAPPIIG